MQYRQLGRSGVQISVIGPGINRFGSDALTQDAMNHVVGAALDLGINPGAIPARQDTG